MKSSTDSERLIRIEDKLDSALGQLAEHHGSLYGNGKPGLVLDVDRLKQAQLTARRWFLVVVSVLSTALAAELAHSYFFITRG